VFNGGHITRKQKLIGTAFKTIKAVPSIKNIRESCTITAADYYYKIFI
tara:strand:- start:385 stop:528 length:144 start_codon:yes stop_codon:yes gene_type:complete